ncbi:hypothetical protein GE09DRAFT_947854, partial [Coniochaeta sp. 2T2.1]
ECPYCSKTWVRPSQLNRHILTHTTERPFACTYLGCDHAASQTGHLRKHMERIHGALLCPHHGCTFVSFDSAKLRTHMGTHAEEKEKEKSFACKYPGCGYTTSQSFHLRTHMVTRHKAHSCQNRRCTFVSLDSAEFEIHVGTHDEEKERAFACT